VFKYTTTEQVRKQNQSYVFPFNLFQIFYGKSVRKAKDFAHTIKKDRGSIMNKSLILSTFRVEFRRNGASYKQERTALRWIQRFLNTFTIDHSSQIRHWQCDFFISELKKENHSFDELLQARSALRFMMKRVLSRTAGDDTAADDSSGVIRITA